jgi:hypothetical protein
MRALSEDIKINFSDPYGHGFCRIEFTGATCNGGIP